MSDKPRWPRADALKVAEFLMGYLAQCTERAEIAGSIRRNRPYVGDIEIVYIPKIQMVPNASDLFGYPIPMNLVDVDISLLIAAQVLKRRMSSAGHSAYGPKNKLLVHVPTGIPVDLFATTADCWFNYLVCRTGGTQTNVNICNAAIARGKHWQPYGSGFKEPDGQITTMDSERAVFEHVGLKYLPPEQRP